MELRRSDYIQIMKVKDLQAFGNSIIEVLVGKCQEELGGGEASPVKKFLELGKPVDENMKNVCFMTGGISLDQIPLNWSKFQQVSKIFEIISSCLGTYGVNNNVTLLDTSEVFRKINQIALDIYDKAVGKYEERCVMQEEGEQTKIIDSKTLPTKYQNRLQSAVLNNQAVFLYLSLTGDTPGDYRDECLLQIYDLL